MVNYVGVTKHRGGWQAQVTGEYLGWHAKRAPAIAAVARATGLAAGKLRKRPVPEKAAAGANIQPLRTHRHVYWITARQLWQAKVPGRASFTNASLPKVVEQVSKILKKPPDSFRLRARHAVDHGSDCGTRDPERGLLISWA